MLKRLLKCSVYLSCCVLAVTEVQAEDLNPTAGGATTQTQSENPGTPTKEAGAAALPVSEDVTKTAVEEPVIEPRAAPEVRQIGELPWHTDYSAAYRQAKTERKQLLLYFRDEKNPAKADKLEQNGLSRPELRTPLSKFARVVLSTNTLAPLAKDAKEGAKPIRLLDYRCYVHMRGQAGLAIVDMMNDKDHLYGKCVSAHPLSSNTLENFNSIKIMLELPRGTITQRTLTFVMRTHPERPASVWGQGNPYLFEQARQACQLMVTYGSVGHHDWGTRSSRISGQFGSGPSEVASMGWGGNLFDAAHACVNLWRGSGTHWSMMITPNRFFGYDMVQSPNGTWYANGLFVQ